MPTLAPYRLTFRGGLHIGTRGVNLEEAGMSIASDTLFAALLDAWRRAGGAVQDFVAPFPSDPPLLLTSAFPFVGDVLFFPMPLNLAMIFSRKTIQSRGKELKSIRYLSKGLLEIALAGNLLDDHLFPADERAEPVNGSALQGGGLWFSLDELPRFPKDYQRDAGRRHSLRNLRVWSSERTPRVTISRITSASNLFHAGRVIFADGCGLWFGVQWRKPDAGVGEGNAASAGKNTPLTYREAFGQALDILQDDGLGGERTAGYGAFHRQEGEPFTLGGDPELKKLAYLLSRYHPSDAELPAALTAREDTAYQLIAVGGWLRSPDGPAQRRKRVYMLAEGSLLCPTVLPAGDLCDVRPTYQNPQGDLPHPIYRSGLALLIAWPEPRVRS